jgi:hypothetical protein
MAHDAREGKWRGNWWMEWVASTLHTTSEQGVSSITTDDAHTSAASSRLNWRPRWFKRTCPFRRTTKSGFCACAITFQTQSTSQILRCVGCFCYDVLEERVASNSRVILMDDEVSGHYWPTTKLSKEGILHQVQFVLWLGHLFMGSPWLAC